MDAEVEGRLLKTNALISTLAPSEQSTIRAVCAPMREIILRVERLESRLTALEAVVKKSLTTESKPADALRAVEVAAEHLPENFPSSEEVVAERRARNADCPACGGAKVVAGELSAGEPFPCGRCHGRGMLPEDTIPTANTCHGTGKKE